MRNLLLLLLTPTINYTTSAMNKNKYPMDNDSIKRVFNVFTIPASANKRPLTTSELKKYHGTSQSGTVEIHVDLLQQQPSKKPGESKL